MRFRLYIDEDRLSHALLAALSAVGFDALPCFAVGMLGKADEEHLALASSLGRVIYSANVGDFAALHGRWLAQGRSHAGIIVCNSQSWSVGEQLRRITAVDQQYRNSPMTDIFEHLSTFS